MVTPFLRVALAPLAVEPRSFSSHTGIWRNEPVSTFAYAALTSRRQAAQPDTSTSKAPPGLKTYADAFAALVPAEVLALHGAILAVVTEKTAENTTTITDPATLKWAFVALLVVSVGIYVTGRLPTLAGGPSTWDTWDWVRMWIPALAFIGWTMLQKTTAFDAIAPHLGQAPRFTIAIIAGGVLGVVASQLAYRADKTKPGP
jgi:hypothetical protein